MKIFISRERAPNETRAALLPQAVEQLKKLGCQITTEAGLGKNLYIDDHSYEQAGAKITEETHAALADADLVVGLMPPPIDHIHAMSQGATYLGFIDPFWGRDRLYAFKEAGVTALSLELLPRTTTAQKMDALSSQASLAGYAAVMLAATRLQKIFPMMMTPCGTIAPARVFIIGAGVAGLQAIATAKRLGARVEAYDTRAEVKEQILSLGAKFHSFDIDNSLTTAEGYAAQQSNLQLEKQRSAMSRILSNCDIVITTAALFGKRAPLLITQEMTRAMKPGAILVDLAVESGGNIEGVRLGDTLEIEGKQLIGLPHLARQVPFNASQMYGNNIVSFIEEFYNLETKNLALPNSCEIVKSCMVTCNGEIVHKRFLAHEETNNNGAAFSVTQK